MIQSLATAIANVFKFHKLKIAVAILSAMIFAVLIFPYDDLSGLLSSVIARGTQNQVYVQFDKLGIDIIPSPGLSLENVEIDTPLANGIEAGSLTLSPSIPSLLVAKLGITTRLTDFLNGRFSLSYNSKNSLTSVDGSGDYEISGENLDLSRVAKVMNLELPLRGRISIDAEGSIDLKFEEPARADFDVTGEQVQLMPTMLNIPNFGPMNLPGLTLSQMSAKGRFLPQERGGTRNQMAQELVLEEVILGTEKDPLQARVRGKVQVNLLRSAAGIRALPGSYELRIQITARPAAQKDFGLFLSFLDSHKKETAAGSLYQFRVAANSTTQPPAITTLQVFQ